MSRTQQVNDLLGTAAKALHDAAIAILRGERRGRSSEGRPPARPKVRN